MSEGKVEQSELYARSEAFFAQDGWDGAEPHVVAVAFAKELQIEAYERGVRDALEHAALLVDFRAFGNTGKPITPQSTILRGETSDAIRGKVDKLLQSNPYRGKEPTK